MMVLLACNGTNVMVRSSYSPCACFFLVLSVALPFSALDNTRPGRALIR